MTINLQSKVSGRRQQQHLQLYSSKCLPRQYLDRIFLLLVISFTFVPLVILHKQPSLEGLSKSTLFGHDAYPTLDLSLAKGLPSNSSNIGFAACLLTMEDEFVLPEWLAYHYTTLPLRRLIVAVDPRSRTKPTEILDRWHGLIDITEWNDTRFFPTSYRATILQKQRVNGTSDNQTTSDQLTLLHRFRQRFFYLNCLRQIKKERRHSWVVLIDSDEFLQSPNPNWKYYPWLLQQLSDSKQQEEQQSLSQSSPSRSRPSPSQIINKWTALELLHRLGKSIPPSTSPCIGLPRLLFGTKKDKEIIDIERAEPYNSSSNGIRGILRAINISYSDLLTLEWLYHGRLVDTTINKAGKSMVDVTSVPFKSMVFRNTDIHRPVMDYCSENNVWMKNIDSPWIIRHYVGSFEQWTSRLDARQSRTKERYDTYQQLDAGRDGSIIGWVDDFVRGVGIVKARSLLINAGVVPHELRSDSNSNNNTTLEAPSILVDPSMSSLRLQKVN